MQNFDIEDEDNLVVSLPLEDGTELDCDVILIFELEGQDYVALYPCDGEPDEVYLYRYTEKDNGEPVLENIESDEEYETVADAFDEELDAMEYEELYAEEDAENEE